MKMEMGYSIEDDHDDHNHHRHQQIHWSKNDWIWFFFNFNFNWAKLVDRGHDV